MSVASAPFFSAVGIRPATPVVELESDRIPVVRPLDSERASKRQRRNDSVTVTASAIGGDAVAAPVVVHRVEHTPYDPEHSELGYGCAVGDTIAGIATITTPTTAATGITTATTPTTAASQEVDVGGSRAPPSANTAAEDEKRPAAAFVTQEEDWLRKAQLAVATMVQEARSTLYMELEVRLGRLDPSGRRFDPGVTRETFEKQLERCEGSPHLRPVVGLDGVAWSESTDFFLECDASAGAGSGSVVRASKDERGLSVFVRKETKSQYDCRVGSSSQYDLRVSLKSEVPAQAVAGRTTLVRYKSRRSFLYRDTFRYDFTYVWQGDSLERARASPPRHEIEVECLHVRYNKSDGRPASCSYVARSLLMKAADMLAPAYGGCGGNKRGGSAVVPISSFPSSSSSGSDSFSLRDGGSGGTTPLPPLLAVADPATLEHQLNGLIAALHGSPRTDPYQQQQQQQQQHANAYHQYHQRIPVQQQGQGDGQLWFPAQPPAFDSYYQPAPVYDAPPFDPRFQTRDPSFVQFPFQPPPVHYNDGSPRQNDGRWPEAPPRDFDYSSAPAAYLSPLDRQQRSHGLPPRSPSGYAPPASPGRGGWRGERAPLPRHDRRRSPTRRGSSTATATTAVSVATEDLPPPPPNYDPVRWRRVCEAEAREKCASPRADHALARGGAQRSSRTPHA